MNGIIDNLRRVTVAAPNITVCAVSKNQSIEKIRTLLDCGHRHFGENRVQEAFEKFGPLRTEFSDLRLHMIGALQTNKARKAVQIFDVIETLDRPELAEALADAIQKYGRAPQLYIEVNIGSEPQKAGVLPQELENLLNYCRQTLSLPIGGLMCIPPAAQDPRPFFSQLHTLTKTLKLKECSMGMSADYEAAIDCGATEIRVGSALFGMIPPT